MFSIDIVFAYFGPETMLPMTSIVATVIGLVMMFGRNLWFLATRCWRAIFPRRARRNVARGPLHASKEKASGNYHRLDGPESAEAAHGQVRGRVASASHAAQPTDQVN